jgi:hypothetical protein
VRVQNEQTAVDVSDFPYGFPFDLEDSEMPFVNGQVSVGSTATQVCAVPGGSGALLQNLGSAAVFIGGPSVAATGALQGISVGAGASITLAAYGFDTETSPHELWAIVATGTNPLNYLVLTGG